MLDTRPARKGRNNCRSMAGDLSRRVAVGRRNAASNSTHSTAPVGQKNHCTVYFIVMAQNQTTMAARTTKKRCCVPWPPKS